MVNILKLPYFSQIKWMVTLGVRLTGRAALNFVAALAITAFSQVPALAQSIDTSKIKQASESIISSVQAVSGIGVTLLLIVGFALLMWGGALDAARVKALRVIGWSVLGGALLFLFAQPLGDFLTGTFGAKS